MTIPELSSLNKSRRPKVVRAIQAAGVTYIAKRDLRNHARDFTNHARDFTNHARDFTNHVQAIQAGRQGLTPVLLAC